MADGNTHDKAGLAIALSTTAIASLAMPENLLGWYAAFSVLAFTHLGPDLDSSNFKANTIKRWKSLKFLWTPFNRWVQPHRGPTHCPYTGPIWALAYFTGLIAAGWGGGALAGWWGLPDITLIRWGHWLRVTGIVYIAALIQYWAHLALDGILIKRLMGVKK